MCNCGNKIQPVGQQPRRSQRLQQVQPNYQQVQPNYQQVQPNYQQVQQLRQVQPNYRQPVRPLQTIQNNQDFQLSPSAQMSQRYQQLQNARNNQMPFRPQPNVALACSCQNR